MADNILKIEHIQYPVVPAREILEKYAIVEMVDWQKVQGKCNRDDNGGFRVTISRYLCEFSYGFPYAHELGHIVMGHWRYDTRRITKVQANILKKEADRFAAELLMPEAWMREEFYFAGIRNFRDLRRYVQGFGVSWYAMETRLAELELCSKEYLKTL